MHSITLVLLFYNLNHMCTQLYNFNNNHFSFICLTNSVLFYWFSFFFLLFAQSIEPLGHTGTQSRVNICSKPQLASPGVIVKDWMDK